MEIGSETELRTTEIIVKRGSSEGGRSLSVIKVDFQIRETLQNIQVLYTNPERK